MTKEINLGGSFTFANTSLTVSRMGYGAMQLAGPQVWGPPRDPEEAVRVLREALDAGVNHIDTSDYYGPHVTNQIIKQALHPYRDGLVIVTKVGARRGPDNSWIHARSRQELIDAVHDNLRTLVLDDFASPAWPHLMATFGPTQQTILCRILGVVWNPGADQREACTAPPVWFLVLVFHHRGFCFRFLV